MKLKRAYIDFNYMDESGQIDLAAVFVDQNYDSLEGEDGRAMQKKHIKKFGRRALLTQKEIVEGTNYFNDEELFYLNRVAFRLLKEKG